MGRKRKFNLASVEDNKDKVLEQKEDSQKQENVSQGKEEEQKIEYKVFGNEDLLLKKIDFLDYQKISNKMLFLQYHLLGQFDNVGNYYINNDIKKDLIKVQKEIQVEDSNGYVAHLRYAKLVFEFEINLTYNEDRAKASLVLVEKLYDQTVKTVIDTYEEENNSDFRINVRKRYNLVDVAFTIRDEEVPNLNIWLYWQSEEYLYWQDLYEMGSQFFVLKAIAILETYGEKGAEIINIYKQQVEFVKEKNGDPKFSKLKEILDKVVNKFGGYEKLDEGNRKLGKLAQEFSKPFFSKDNSKASIVEASTKSNKGSSKSSKVEDYSWRNTDKASSSSTGKKSASKKTATKKSSSKDDAKKKSTGSFSIDEGKKDLSTKKETIKPATNQTKEVDINKETKQKEISNNAKSVLANMFSGEDNIERKDDTTTENFDEKI